jgi:type VI secretion system protein ImpA
VADFDIEQLLKPVSDAAPCGKDLGYDPAFTNLQELARGKPAQEVGNHKIAGEPPPWPKVRDAAEALFASTKDLRVAGILHESLMRLSGVSGLANGLALFSALLDRYWEQVYPLLDAEEDNDPTFRVNSLISAIASDEVIVLIRTLPLVESRQSGRHSIRSYRIATGVLKAEGEGDPAKELGRFEAAVTEMDLAALQGNAAALASAAESVNSMQKVLLDRADGIPQQLSTLAAELKDMKAFLDAQLDKRGVGAGPESTAGPTSGEGGSVPDAQPAGQGLSGDVRTRADVTRAIDRICEYYRRSEPSSPVPLLLERAKRLVNKDFMDIIRDLTPTGVAEAEVIVGLEKKQG